MTVYKPVDCGNSTFLDIRGKKYHIKVWGENDAPVLFYLHGWADTGSTFQFVVDALQSKWRIIAIDWRGFGRSEKINSNYWFPDYLADLDEILRFHSSDQPATLIGHSMGANIASLYAGIKPEAINQLINIEGFGLNDSDPKNAPNNYRRWLEQQQLIPVFKAYASYNELVPRILKRSPNMKLEQAEFVAREWAYKDANGQINLHADPFHKLPNAVQYRRQEAEACWQQIQARTLFIWGENTNFKEQMQLLKEVNSKDHPFFSAKTECVSDAGHMIHFEAPKLLALAIENFLLNN